ncbi:hypothetical protein PR048_026509 [Dryococelus australis]|uniref:N-acetylglucosaminylphosphatidylinositol deacetylase n=1 Tax=Dryococelus australis TaxID=614101 RepID=A0ABQ9GLJ6_9NEOP|nr:hypothetical protein PR048_026509 [Dryococelus australis]
MMERMGALIDIVVSIVKNLVYDLAACIGLMYLLAVCVMHMDIYGSFFQMARRRMLVLTAYPTNECTFFGPLIVRISADKDSQIYLLSLCRDADEDTDAMWRCCNFLGIPDSHVTMFRSDHLPKHARERWREEDMMQVILYQVESLDIDALVTFDWKGVTGDYSHTSMFHAVAHLMVGGKLPSSCRVFVLETVSLSSGRLGILDVPLSLSAQSYAFVASTQQRKHIMRALRQHTKSSQVFGQHFRYSGVNTLREIDVMELVLENSYSLFE